VEPPAGETSAPIGEGVGLFRGLLLMLLFYAALGWALWFAWHAWRQWQAH